MKTLQPILLPAAAFALAPAALAQSILPLVVEGDLVPGVGVVTRVDNLSINDQGRWLVEVDTDNADGDTDGAVLDAFGVVLREGQALNSPGGATLGSFDSLALDLAGRVHANHFLDGPGTGLDSGVYVDDVLVIQEGDVLNAAGVGAGTFFRGFFDVKASAEGRTIVLATVDDPNVPTTVEQIFLTFDGGGPIQKIFGEGDVLPGQAESISTFGTGPHQSAFDGDGGLVFFADVEGDTSTDGVIYRFTGSSTVLVAQEGGASPIAGRSWSSLSSPEVAVDAFGRVAYSGRLDGDSASDTVLVFDGAVVAQEGGPVPDVPGFAFTSFGSGPLALARTGDFIWYGDWDDPDTSVDSGLFLGEELLVQEGVSTVGGVVIDTLRGVQDGYAISGNGRWILFEAILQDGREGVFLIDGDLSTPVSVCAPATNNSTGAPGRLALTGYDVAGGLPLRLVATDLPPNQFGFFVVSQTTANVPFPGGSDGVLCLGGAIGRFNAQIASTGANGYLEIGVDTNLLPVLPGVAAQAGQTWTFQGWHRDFNPTQTSNFTEARSILFL